jgi:hypothetical protein
MYYRPLSMNHCIYLAYIVQEAVNSIARMRRVWGRCGMVLLLLYIIMPTTTPASSRQGTADHGILIRLLVRDHGRTLVVSVQNTTSQSICVPLQWTSGARVTMYRNGVAQPSRVGFEGRPPPGCVPVSQVSPIITTYDLYHAYSGARIGDRICYDLPWKRYSGGTQRRLTRCIVVGRA